MPEGMFWFWIVLSGLIGAMLMAILTNAFLPWLGNLLDDTHGQAVAGVTIMMLLWVLGTILTYCLGWAGYLDLVGRDVPADTWAWVFVGFGQFAWWSFPLSMVGGVAFLFAVLATLSEVR